MAEITDAFARFILECKDAWEDMCARIENGEVPAGTKARVEVEISADRVDEIRCERLSLMGGVNGNG